MSITMRQQFTATMQYLMDNDEKVITLLNDIGVFAFRHIKAKYPDRMYNLGILEQSSISISAGMSLTGMIPVFHTIAPFIVERGYEQLKDDFGYQNINGNFVSVGASYDYSKLGTTHYCPADVGILKQIPNMQITVPGTAEEFDYLLKRLYNNGSPTYFRLSERSNQVTQEIEFGKAKVMKKGEQGTVIAIGTMLDRVMQAAENFDVTVLYYTTLEPFDSQTLKNNTKKKKILLCEPYYYGALTSEIVDTFNGSPVLIKYAGIPHKTITSYGSVDDIDADFGLDVAGIMSKIAELVDSGG